MEARFLALVWDKGRVTIPLSSVNQSLYDLYTNAFGKPKGKSVTVKIDWKGRLGA